MSNSGNRGGSPPQKISIVGIAAELPSGAYADHNLDHKQFFEFLLQEGESYEVVPENRFNVESFYGQGLGQVKTARGSFLKDVDLFDPTEFGISTKDARAMSLSTRKLVELSFLALLDSGLDYRGQNVGCYAAGTAFDILSVAEPDELEAKGSFAGIPCMISNKISYHLDLRGPSIPIDTACSSSLTALHLAVQALRAGECEAAVVGGCQINMRLADFVQYSQGGVLAPDGKCKPFDAGADGFSRGEGAVVVVLKPYEDAVRDGDHVYANVLGSGINTAGSLAPAYAPVGEAQADAMKRAYRGVEVNPREVDFVEMHATGTAAGDPTEAKWVGQAFGREDELMIGSVKGNIGHLEITAFLASLSKVISVMETGIVPPNANLREPNPAIPWEKYHLTAPLTSTPLHARDASGKLLVSMCSSGIGGANGHVVLQSADHTTAPEEPAKTPRRADAPVLIVAGGLSPRSATAVADSLRETVQSNPEKWADLSVIAGRRNRQMPWRTFGVAKPTKDSIVSLQFPAPSLSPRQRPPLVFLFSGQGPQHINMGRQLFQQFPVFRSAIIELDQCYERVVGHSLMRQYGLFKDYPDVEALSSVWPISIILPSLAMVQMALFDLLGSVGIKPDFVLGHSAGETSVFYASGAASREMAMEVAIARGRAMELVEKHNGTMASLSCSPAQAQSIIEVVASGSPKILDIACFNSHDAVVVAGHQSLVDVAVELATKYGIMARKIRTRVPVHSRMMELCEEEYRALIDEVYEKHGEPCNASVTAYSTCTGDKIQAFDRDYFWKNTRNPVLFTQTVEAILRDHPGASFIEVSPHPVLSAYLQELGAASSSIVSPMRRQKEYLSEFDEQTTLLQALGQLSVLGCNDVNFQALNNLHHEPDRSLVLPSYPFSKKAVPFRPDWSPHTDKQLALHAGPLNRPGLRVNAQTHPGLADHIIHGEPIMPAAGFLEMALEQGATTLSDVTFHSVLALSSEVPLVVDVKTEGPKWTVESRSLKQKAPRLHASGNMFRGPVAASGQLNVESIRARLKSSAVEAFYGGLSYFAQYGPDYRRVTEAYFGFNEALVKVRGTGSDLPDGNSYVFHPAILDAAIHVTVHPSFTANSDPNIYYLPGRVEKFAFTESFRSKSLPTTLYAHATLREWYPHELVTDVSISDESGEVLCLVHGLVLERHFVSPERVPEKRLTVVYQPWKSETGQRLKIGDNELSESKKPEYVVLDYVLGQEMAIQNALVELDQQVSHKVWFTASQQSLHAARGFTRSLRRECPLWDISLAAFDGCYTTESQASIVSHLANVAGMEHEILVDSKGQVLVPRFVRTAAPSFSLDDIEPKLKVPSSHVEIEVLSASLSDVDAFGVLGRISAVADDCDASLIGSLVITVVKNAPQAQIVVHCGAIAMLPASFARSRKLAHVAPIFLVGGAVLGVPALRNPTRMKLRKFGVTHGSAGDVLLSFFKALDLDATQLPARDAESLLDLVRKNGLSSTHIALTDITVDVRLDNPTTRLVNWRSVLIDVLAPSADPWTVGDILTTALTIMQNVRLPSQASRIPAFTPAPYPYPSRALFDNDKAYLLIGGIGSLGMHIALWMYQNGARHLTMTSRSGFKSLERAGDVLALRMLTFLQKQSDLYLSLQASDASSPDDLKRTISLLDRPLAGCILLSGLLSDGNFFSQTASGFQAVFKPKLTAFEAVEAAVDIRSLDFLVATSSIATFGNAGQTNYSSANAAVEGKCSQYSNAFAIVSPAITDTVSMVGRQDLDYQVTRFQHLMSWAYSARELCHCIGDGLLKTKNESLDIYIPDLDWNLIHKNLGPSSLYDHLVKVDTAAGAVDASETPEDALRRTALEFLDVDAEEFSSEVPFTSYGLDSISATRLSFALRPYLALSQIQLLGDMSLDDVVARLQRQAGGARVTGTTQVVGQSFDWKNVDTTQQVVKLCDHEGNNPFIMIHGGAGTVRAFIPFQMTFKSSLWCIHVTPDTPLDTLPNQAHFYYDAIKAARPEGPYRLGGYCSSATLLFFLAKLFEDNGDNISQLVVLDGSPLIFASPMFEPDEQTIAKKTPSDELRQKVIQDTLELYKLCGSHSKKLAEEIEGCINDPTAPVHIREWLRIIDAHTVNIYDFMLSLLPLNQPYSTSALRAATIDWMKQVKTPLTALIAEHGLLSQFQDKDRSNWTNLGLDWAFPDSNIYRFNANHFDIMDRVGVSELLQQKS